MIVKSERYPSLLVVDLGIRFRDGEAEVTDPAALDRLRDLEHMGVVVPKSSGPGGSGDAPEPKRRTTRPRKQD